MLLYSGRLGVAWLSRMSQDALQKWDRSELHRRELDRHVDEK